jgi:hypothetical protein
MFYGNSYTLPSIQTHVIRSLFSFQIRQFRELQKLGAGIAVINGTVLVQVNNRVPVNPPGVPHSRRTLAFQDIILHVAHAANLHTPGFAVPDIQLVMGMTDSYQLIPRL